MVAGGWSLFLLCCECSRGVTECFLSDPLALQPLKVMDPDHPLAALVRKAKQERNGTAAMETKQAEGPDPAAAGTPAQYATDRELPHLSSSVAALNTGDVQLVQNKTICLHSNKMSDFIL